ncbi:MAG: hypothetical protein GTO40_17955 [Deltaproteobacteria bacterium]|nr:hypothetical protein [Deltaproteobacteria bacterium]
MKILFVCHGNTGRSQVAEALFNRLSRHQARSAGTRVEASLAKRGTNTSTVKDAEGAQPVIEYMRDEGINVSDKTRSQLTREMVEVSDRVVVITAKETWPEYLMNNSKVDFWDIPNPLNMDSEAARAVYEKVKKHVKDLVSEIG